MIITRFECTPCVMPKEDPSWKFALAATSTIEGAIVRIETDSGAYGFGYASSVPHMGSSMRGLLGELDFFRSAVLGADARNIEAILLSLDHSLKDARQSKAAIDCALHDLVARSLGVPLNQMFGGVVRDRVPILRILAIKQPQEMAAQAQRLVEQGYSYLKIKVGGEIADDVARVAAIRRQVGDRIHLTIDANQAYCAKDAIKAISRMAEFNIDLVEQPVHLDDRAGLALVTQMSPVTIEADEAAGSLRDIYDLVSNRTVDAISLKIPKLGGLRNTLAAARICEAGGVRYRLGAAVGSRLLSAQAIHLACSLRGVDYACELGEFARLLDDPFEGIEIEDGHLKLPRAAASGVHPRALDGAVQSPSTTISTLVQQ